jgi:hypothetical protein
MSKLRLVIIAMATICVLALAVLAIAGGQMEPAPGDDVIIIKGGSLEIQCGKNHGTDCLGSHDSKGMYKHKKNTAHIMKVEVKDGYGKALYSGAFDATTQPQIEITYK